VLSIPVATFIYLECFVLLISFIIAAVKTMKLTFFDKYFAVKSLEKIISCKRIKSKQFKNAVSFSRIAPQKCFS
jgi:hypothetical protein